ncbi:MAG: DUF2203 domain-containing protein [Acidobacteriaceae bacterium]
MKTFSLDEAQSLLPLLESLLTRAMEAKETAEQLQMEMQQLKQRIFLAGGMTVDLHAVALNREGTETNLKKANEALTEIDSIGVQVKDLETGLLDFPCRVEDEVVLLCWKRGEERIDYWHTTDAGFRGRRPLDDRFRGRGGPARPN